jgi:hypothetical protein
VRWHILRTLVHKEVLRHAANRGGLALIALLVAAALLLSFFGKDPTQPGSLTGGAQRCYIDYWQDGPWIDHLRESVPADLTSRLVFREAAAAPTEAGKIVYPPGHGAIQIRTKEGTGGQRYQVWVWHPGADGGLSPFEAWFWKESFRYLRRQALRAGPGSPALGGLERLEIDEGRSRLAGPGDTRSALATALVLFGLFFVCVYLLPSLACEERERGVLLAQALSPASPREILAARYLFYPVLGMGLAALLAGLYQPAALARPFFWLALLAAAFGAMGVGLTIASLARSQRTASMAALCYLLAVALVLVICQQNGILGVPWLALEYHCPRMLQAALAGSVHWSHWANLASAAALALTWSVLATALFRRQGWQ